MAVKIRLQRKGRTKAPFYHIVIADARSPRDGKFIEKIGTYNPMTTPATINIDRDAAFDWIMKGAQPTDTIRAILRFKGVLYKKHLMRGVSKGAMTPEVAEEMYQSWISTKDAKIASRVEKSKEDIAKRHEALSGTAKPKKAKEEEAVEQVAVASEVTSEENPTEVANQEVTEVAPPVEATQEVAAEAAAPAEETAADAVAEETPAAEASSEETKADDTTENEA